MTAVRIKAGNHYDLASPAEVHAAVKKGLQSWREEAHIGGTFPRFGTTGKVLANNTLRILGDGMDQMGPPPGFVWDIRRLRVTGLSGADVVSVGINSSSSPGMLVATTNDIANTTGPGSLFLWDRQVVLMPGDHLDITGISLATAVGSTVTVNGQALELPVSQLWRLVGPGT